MTEDLPKLEAEALSAVAQAATIDEIRSFESTLLGKQSALSQAKSSIGSLPPEQRKDAGRALNEVRQKVEAALEERRGELARQERAVQLEGERLDLTEVDGGAMVGHSHVVTQTWEAWEDTFVGMGYRIAEGPEVETDWHNFDALNIPPDHPARDGFDTIYVNHGKPGTTLLRTHTSPGADPHHAGPGAPHLHRGPRSGVPARHRRCHPPPGVPPDRGPRGGPRHLAGRSGGHARGLHRGLLRAPASPPASVPTTSLHRAVGRVRRPAARRVMGSSSGCGMVHPNVLRAGASTPRSGPVRLRVRHRSSGPAQVRGRRPA